MKNLTLLAALLLVILGAVGCSSGGGAGDPNVNASTAPPVSSDGIRPGTPGAPPVKKQ
jgi:hypothetical protein